MRYICYECRYVYVCLHICVIYIYIYTCVLDVYWWTRPLHFNLFGVANLSTRQLPNKSTSCIQFKSQRVSVYQNCCISRRQASDATCLKNRRWCPCLVPARFWYSNSNKVMPSQLCKEFTNHGNHNYFNISYHISSHTVISTVHLSTINAVLGLLFSLKSHLGKLQ